MSDLSTLYRPVGQAELDLIEESGWLLFPPRLEHQPIFYPVTNEDYAVQIARDWNTKDEASGFVGYVTRFSVNSDYLAKFERKIVGSSQHEELWVPAEDLTEFNKNIVGPIELIHKFGVEPSETPHNKPNEPGANPSPLRASALAPVIGDPSAVQSMDLPTTHRSTLEEAIGRLYRVFQRYSFAGSNFCGYCYTDREIQRLTETPARELAESDVRKLFWENSGHWESPEVYRHYLPRILEAMAPPLKVEELYPGHLSETIRALEFADWPTPERSAVLEYLRLVGPLLESHDDEEHGDWCTGLELLERVG